MPSLNKYITQAAVKARYGGKSDMTLWRWLHDPLLNFPKPIKLRNRNLWGVAELDAFDDRMAATARGSNGASAGPLLVEGDAGQLSTHQRAEATVPPSARHGG